MKSWYLLREVKAMREEDTEIQQPGEVSKQYLMFSQSQFTELKMIEVSWIICETSSHGKSDNINGPEYISQISIR